MKWSGDYRIRLVLAGSIAATMLGGIRPANGTTFTVGPGADHDFGDIQAGIDAAHDADTVLVAPGEYVITEPITFRGKVITVQSEEGPDETTIRMGTPADTKRGSVVVFENNETTESILDGFTITDGRGSLVVSLGEWGGGGIVFDASAATVKHCAIVENTVQHGGGVICLFPCSPTLIDCTIAENIAELGMGGGLFASSGASPSLSNCIVSNNSSTGTDWGSGIGGGACCLENSSMTMADCTVAGNLAAQGGGAIFCGEGASLTATRCALLNNAVGIWGGGVVCWLPGSSTAISNCTVLGNSAGTNGGGLGCYDGSSATVVNSILWGNTAPAGSQIHLEQRPTEFTIKYSNVAGGWAAVSIDGEHTLNWGAGNIDADPLFADAAGGDCHLKSQAGRWEPKSQRWVQDDVTSPCIDTADPMSPINSEPFPNGGFVNMGAYGCTPEASKAYFGEPICETIVAGDINGDGHVNRADLEIMALHWTDEEPLRLP